MFIIQDGKITSEKTLDIGKLRVINLVFKSGLQFADDDKFKLVLGSIQSENYAFVDDGCLRFSYVDVSDVITKSSSAFSVQILHNGSQILADSITITAVIQGGGQIVLPDVTVTADKMLKDITAINTDGAVVTGNIENAVVTTDEVDGLTVSVSKGYLANAETKSFSASTITTDETDGLTVNISKGYVSADQAKNFDSSTVTETDTQVTVSRGWLKEDKTFSVGGGSGEETQGVIYNAFPLNQSTQVKFIPTDITKNVTNFSYMFSDYSALTSIPQIDTSNGTNFYYMFYNCKKITSIPQINTSKGTNFSYMFQYCSSLTSIPQINTSKGTNFSYMFSNTYLTSIPQLDTSNGTNFSYMFSYTYLTSIPQLDTSNGTNFSNMFSYNWKLTTLPPLDVSKGINFGNMFYFCEGLTDFGGLLNIKYSYSLANSTNLTHQSLLNALNGLYDLTGSTSQTLTLGTTNLAKLTDQEKAIATNKNWVLA